jgi:hypothetical protein
MPNTVTLDFTIPADTPAGDPSYSLDATLTLSTTANAQGYYTVEGATGTITIGGTPFSVTGVALGVDSSDNLFNPSGTPSFVDNDGLTFITTDPNADATGATTPSTDVNFYSNGGDYFVDGSSGSPVTASSVSVSNLTLCFCSGAHIRTTRGEVAVEDLAIGDLAVTASGEARPIVWIGHKQIERPARDQQPVRVMAGAFGQDLPARDLRLSPGHAVCVDVMGEVFIPAGELVNGATIVREQVAEVTYWHVELESHDVLLAEGLPAESYIDVGNKAWFGREHGRLAAVDADRDPMAGYARPLVTGGRVVEAVRARLTARAEALGWTRSPDIDLHLMVDGRRVEPDMDGDLARFIFPAKAKSAALVSRTFSPSWTGKGAERRTLGVRIDGLRIGDGLRLNRDIPLGALVGVHPEEADGGVAWRWTTGELDLPAALWAEAKDQVFLRLAHKPQSVWAWVAPTAAPAIAAAA